MESDVIDVDTAQNCANDNFEHCAEVVIYRHSDNNRLTYSVIRSETRWRTSYDSCEASKLVKNDEKRRDRLRILQKPGDRRGVDS